MGETKLSPETPATKPESAGNRVFDKLRRHVSTGEVKAERQKLQDDPEAWRGQE